MQEVVINVRVKDNEVEELQKDLNKLGVSFDKVDNEAKKASTSIKDVGDNGGAIALLDNLTGGLATQLKDAAEASKLFNFSLKGTRTALIATGIGAFVVAAGTLVAYWSDIKDFITGSNTELQKQIDLQQEILISAERELQTLDKQDNILKLQGKTQREINKQKKEALKIVIQEAEEQLRLAQQRLEELEAIKKAGGSGLESFLTSTQIVLNSVLKTVDKFFKKIGFNTDFAGTQFSVSESILESIFGTQEDIDEADARVKELEDKILDARNRLAGITLSEVNNNDSPESQVRDTRLANELETISKLSEVRLQELDLEATITEGLEAEAARRRLIREAEVEFAKNKNDVIFDTASTLQDALFKLGEENKAFAVAGIVVEQVAGAANAIQNLLVANTKAKAAFPVTFGQPFVAINTISTLAGIAAGAAAASKAISQIGGGSGGGISQTPSAGGGGGSSAQAPSFNLVGSSGISQLSQQLNQDQEPIQAFVVASAVTSQQELDQNIVDGATIE